MNKKKSQEYLDKINQSFAEMDEPAFEIDVDTLLGYVRIFYSSLKSIPVQSNDISKSHNQTKKEMSVKNENPVGDFLSKSTNKPLMMEDSKPKTDPVRKEEPIKTEPENNERKIELWPESNTDQILEETEITIPSDNPDPIVGINMKEAEILQETSEPQQYIKTFEEEDLSVSGDEDVKDNKPVEIQIPVIEKQKQEVVQPAPPGMESKQGNEPLLVLPDIKKDKPPQMSEPISRAKETILTKIEGEQSRTLYQPTGQSVHNASDAIEALFKEKSPTGLVDFLGLSPLDNLNKAWGLNEKMLVIKDLFDDDYNSFNDTVDLINKFTSFQEVKYYLTQHVVDKFKWYDLSKFKKASDFIVQTKRLFVK